METDSTTNETNGTTDTTETPAFTRHVRARAVKALGVTGECHYRRKDEHTAGDMLCDALSLESDVDLSAALHVIASEVDMLTDCMANGHGASMDDEKVAEVFYNIERRIRVLAEVARRMAPETGGDK